VARQGVEFVGYASTGEPERSSICAASPPNSAWPGIDPQVALTLCDDFNDDGGCAPRPRQNEALTQMLAALARWAGALRPLRAVAMRILGRAGRVCTARDAVEADEAVGQFLERLGDRPGSG